MCSSTHVREPAQGLDGICWQLICMSRSLLVLMQCGALMLGVSVSMHDVSSSNAATSNASLQDAGGSTRSRVVEAIIK